MADLRRLWRWPALLLAAVLLAGCTAEPIWAPTEDVQRAVYRHSAPTSITLYTVVSNRSQSGAHSGLLVNGSQRVIYDPAGTFRHPQLPERNDVVFGMTPSAVNFYIDYHARETYHVVSQEIIVSPQTAELALRLVQEAGAAPKASCTTYIGNVMRQIPGFQDFPRTPFPKRAMQYMATKQGVTTQKFFDDSPDNRGESITVPNVR